MSRREFSKPTKRDALRRSGMRCEAVGAWYGWPEGKRCMADLSYGVEFDHIDLDANSRDNSLSNCAAVCVRCHAIKTRTHDIPVAAKTLRQQDRDNGIKTKPRGVIPGSKASRFKRLMDGTVVLRGSPTRSALRPASQADHDGGSD